MQEGQAYETGRCGKNEEIFSPAKYSLTITCSPSPLFSIFCEIVRAGRKFSPLPTLLRLFCPSTGIVALGVRWARRLAGPRILTQVRWSQLESSCLRLMAISVPSLLPQDSWLFIRLLRSLCCSLPTGRGGRLCSRLLIDPMGITLIWCLALVLIKWITSKVGYLYFGDCDINH